MVVSAFHISEIIEATFCNKLKTIASFKGKILLLWRNNDRNPNPHSCCDA